MMAENQQAGYKGMIASRLEAKAKALAAEVTQNRTSESRDSKPPRCY